MTSPLISLAADGLFVDGVALPLPIPTAALSDLLGQPVRWDGKHGSVMTWHDLGLYAHVLDDDHVKTLCIQVLEEEGGGPAFVPTTLFTGTFQIDGTTVRDEVPGADASAKRIADTASTTLHGVRIHATYAGNVLEAVEMKPADKPEPPVPSERYAAKPATVKGLAFTDLNLKLAVIDELMYEQGAIDPTFSLDEFARWCGEQGVEVDTESYDTIPQALAWFENLEIDASLAEQVTSLVIDAGNEIYRQIAPRWDGEDDAFDIGSFEDLALLPRLESIDFISLTPDDDAIEAIRERGIDVDA